MLHSPELTAPASNPTASGLARRATPKFATATSAPIVAADTTIPLLATTGLSDDTAVSLVFDPKGAKEEWVLGFVEGNNLVNCYRGAEGAAYDHDAGTVVMTKSSASDHNGVVDFVLRDHNPDGTHHPSFLLGETRTWPVLAMPDANWLPCDGRSVLRADYPGLFAVLGSLYGAADVNHFSLPDYRGRVLAGYDATQTEFNALSKTGGEKTHILLTAEMPAHVHREVNVGGISNDAIAGYGSGARPFFNSGDPIDTESTGGGGAHNNLQPYAVSQMIIRVLP